MRRLAVRRFALGAVGLVIAATLPLAVAPPVSAAVLTFLFSHGTETVTGTSGNDSISVTCTAGDLQAERQDSGKSCGSVTHLVVKGGGGNASMSIQDHARVVRGDVGVPDDRRRGVRQHAVEPAR